METDPDLATVESTALAPPPLHGSHVRLRPVTSADYGWLFGLATSEEIGYRWRFRGTTPSPDRFVEMLWRNVFVQYVVETLADRSPIGLVQAYGAELRSRYAYVSVLLAPEKSLRGWPLEGVRVFIDYLFGYFNLRKIYIETLEFNLTQFRSAIGSVLTVEGHLKDHDEHLDSYVDLFILALYRDAWDLRAQKIAATQAGGARA